MAFSAKREGGLPRFRRSGRDWRLASKTCRLGPNVRNDCNWPLMADSGQMGRAAQLALLFGGVVRITVVLALTLWRLAESWWLSPDDAPTPDGLGTGGVARSSSPV